MASGDYNLVTSMFLLTVIELTGALSKLWNFLSYEEIFFFRPFVKNGTKNVIKLHIVTSLDIDVMSMRGKFYGHFKVFNVLILGTNFQVHIFP